MSASASPEPGPQHEHTVGVRGKKKLELAVHQGHGTVCDGYRRVEAGQ